MFNFLTQKIIYFRESFIFLKKVLYFKESIIMNGIVLFSVKAYHR